MRTKGQERAEFALLRIENGVKENMNKELKSFTAGAPTVILQNGFGQAMAFWLSKSKGEDKYKFIFDSIKQWLIREKFIYSGIDSDNINFIKELSTINQSEYLAAQKEALMLLEWIKRYASAFCEDSHDE